MNGIIEASDFILRLAAALLLGGIIGFERQWHQKNAGLRTNTLVAIGAASFVLISENLFGMAGGDPGRITAQIVTGIGFIGAGVIMKDGFDIRGLNTAATIWCSAAVGTFAGMGLFVESSMVTTAVIFAHLAFRPISTRLSKLSAYGKTKIRQARYRIVIRCLNAQETEIRAYLLNQFEENDQLLMRSVNRHATEHEPDLIELKIELTTVGKQENQLETLVGQIIKTFDILNAGWELIGEEAEY